MLSQFQARYPTGSLISELLTIYQGKFVVRVSAQIEGITRATGMAAAETLEVAEDQARSRALAVLVIGAEGVLGAGGALGGGGAEGAEGERVSSSPSSVVQPLDFTYGNKNKDFLLETAEAKGINIQASLLAPSAPSAPSPPPDDTQDGNVIPLIPPSYSQDDGLPSQINAETEIRASVPVDLSDAIARTSMELKRLKWTNQQGREYLEKTYNKRSRQHLTDEEMLEFLDYLESQPSPNQPFA